MSRSDTAGQIVHIPLAEHLNDSFEQISHAPRAEAVALAKELRAEEYAKIEHWLVNHVNEISGWDVSVKLTSITDGIVRALADRAFVHGSDLQSPWQEIGLFAIGGYGRGELNPASDLDVMVLHPYTGIPPALQEAYNEFHTLLWDSGFKVGIALRGVTELERLIKDDFVTATAILEHRILMGTGGIDLAMSELLERFRKKRSKAFLKYKIEELMERRNKTGASMFLMEPDLKTNPGCLRDVQLLYNIAYILYGGRNLYGLRELDAVRVQDIKSLFQANAHLLRMRTLQHFHHNRRQDVLELRDQLRIAEQLGYSGYSRLSAVEVMMREHYHMVLRVHKMVELLISHLRLQGHLGKRISLLRSRKVLSKNFTAMAGLVYCTNRKIWEEDDAAAQVMEMFAKAHERNLRVSLETQRHIRSNLHIMRKDFIEDQESDRIAQAFMSILKKVGRVQLTLEEMHNCGFLGAYLPEFSNISCLMQFNSYHLYTVDQHTLFAIGNIDQIDRGSEKGLPGMIRIYQQLRRKDLLLLGLLLHDVGKYMGRGHVARGALMVDPVAKRLKLNPEEEDLVYFLVDQHVSLSDASRMRDISDPDFIKGFASVVQNQEYLDMLYCLTYADAKATSDKVLTGWHMSVLYELYRNISEYLSTNELNSLVSRKEKLLYSLMDRGVVKEQAQRFLDELPYQYSFNVELEDAVHHYEIVQMAEQGNLGFRKTLSDDTACVEVALSWEHHRFADVTGVLSAMGCQFFDARCWALQKRVILFRFQVEHAIPGKLQDEEWWGRVVRELNKLLDGTCNVDALIENRKHNMLYEDRAADSGFNDPAVKVEQKTSKKYSIMDVHHKDEPGSLSRIARVITEFDCDVDYATVLTMGDISTGVFYVAKDDQKLNDEQAFELQTAIAKELDVI